MIKEEFLGIKEGLQQSIESKSRTPDAWFALLSQMPAEEYRALRETLNRNHARKIPYR